MSPSPIVLVPGFWLGAWAWDEVAQDLRDRGHRVTPLTLPGLDDVATDRAGIGLEEHVDAIVRAVEAAGEPVVLAVHSGAGGAGYVATDRVPDRIATMVYVDTGPATGAFEPDLEGDDLPMPSLEQLAEEENLEGLTPEQLETFRDRGVPEPGGVLRDTPSFTNDARLDVPSIAICTAFPSEQYKVGVQEGWAFLGGFKDLRDVTWVDLPTSHWPMWSRPRDLAQILSDTATDA